MEGYVVLGAAGVITLWMMLALMGGERQRQLQLQEAQAAAKAASQAAAEAAAAQAGQPVRNLVAPIPLPAAPRR